MISIIVHPHIVEIIGIQLIIPHQWYFVFSKGGNVGKTLFFLYIEKLLYLCNLIATRYAADICT